MISKMALVAWGLSASLFASNGLRKLSSDVLGAMADVALASPLVDGEDGPRVTMAYEVAIAWLEGANDARAIGDGHASYCWGQINLPHGAHTREGWSGPELVSDPHKCASVVVRILRMSMEKGPADCPLCLYARGRVSDEARRLSRTRVGLAHELLETIPAISAP